MAYTLFEAKEEISRHLGKQNKTVTKLETRELVLRHVNRILKSLRDINHLITHKTVRSELLSGACRTLVETSGYTRAWIVLTNRDKPVPPFYNYGFSDGFAVFGEHLLNHGMPECARRAKVSGNVEVTEDPRNQCPDCPLWHDAANECIHDQKMVTFTAALHHEQEYFGTVSVILPWDFRHNPDDLQLFHEISQDIAYALKTLSLEEDRERVNRQLKDKEQQYEAMYTNAPIPYQSLDSSGHFLNVNPAWLNTLGYNRSEVLGKKFSDFLHPDSRAVFKQNFTVFKLRGHAESIEYRMLHKDGHILWASFDGQVDFYPDGRFRQTYSVFKDISGEKELVDLHQKEQRRFFLLFDNITEGVCFHSLEYDEKQNAVDYRVIDVNPAYENILGLEKENVVGKLGSEIYGVETAPYLDVYSTVVETGVSRHFEIYFPPMDKHFMISAFSTNPGGFATVFFELTDYIKTKELLVQERTLLEQIAQTSPVGITKVDKTGRIVFANRTAEEILGLSRDSITARDYNDVHWDISRIDGSPMPDDELPFSLVKKAEQSVYGVQHALISPQRGKIILSVNAAPVFSESGEFDGAVMVLDDVTLRLEAERKLKAALDEKDFLMKELNHRVKNNLLLITSLLTLKSDSMGNTVDLSDVVNQIDAVRILHERLYLTEEIRYVNIHEYFKEILDSIFSTFTQSSVKMSLTVDAPRLPTRDVIPLGLILNEVATNALKHGFKNIEKPEFSVRLHLNGSSPEFEMRNNGHPVPENIRLDNPSTLGLRLISALAAQLQARIEITKSPHPVVLLRFSREFT